MEVRCPTCNRFICEVPAGTDVRAYCRGCNLKFEPKVVDKPSDVGARSL